MQDAMTEMVLERENDAFRGSGGISSNCRFYSFSPAFLDSETDTVYLSRFADGTPAPIHLLDGLPEEVVVGRDPAGKVVSVKPSIISGFIREGRFFSREAAAARIAELV